MYITPTICIGSYPVRLSMVSCLMGPCDFYPNSDKPLKCVEKHGVTSYAMDPYKAYSNSDKLLMCVPVFHIQRSRSPKSAKHGKTLCPMGQYEAYSNSDKLLMCVPVFQTQRSRSQNQRSMVKHSVPWVSMRLIRILISF
jgi:hypothetical protein